MKMSSAKCCSICCTFNQIMFFISPCFFFSLCVLVSMMPSSPLLPQESLSLSCSVDTQGEKRPHMYWQSPQKVNHSNTVMVKMMVNREDSGEWICVVNNGGKKKEAKVHVTVIGE